MDSKDREETFDTLAASLADGVPAERLATLLAPEMPQAVMERLLTQPRSREKLSQMIMSRLDLPPLQEMVAPNLRFALIGADQMGGAIAAVGAIWHCNVIRQMISKAALLGLIDGIGERAYTVGLANGDLAVAPSTVPTVASLVCAIQRYGRSCVEAWLETVEPASVAELTRLKLPRPPTEVTEINEDHRRLGPEIVRRVARCWLAEFAN